MFKAKAGGDITTASAAITKLTGVFRMLDERESFTRGLLARLLLLYDWDRRRRGHRSNGDRGVGRRQVAGGGAQDEGG